MEVEMLELVLLARYLQSKPPLLFIDSSGNGSGFLVPGLSVGIIPTCWVNPFENESYHLLTYHFIALYFIN